MAVVQQNLDKKKYNKMENVLQHINKNFITVDEADTKKANPILKHVIEQITNAMKQKSKLFEALFQDILYGGSYFDGLKVGKPEEFDIDLRMVLPKLVDATIEVSNQPGFVTIQMKGWSVFEKNTIDCAKFKGLEKFRDDKNFLLVNEVMKWMESIITQALNTFQQNANKKYLIPYNGKNVELTLKKSGPALTTLITYENIYMDVDLVAVFKLSQEQWPPKPFKSLPKNCSKTCFMIVPKSPRGEIICKERYWRMSFQEQEKVIISGLNTCKTALRMIKKLRDTQNHNKISSYFIKTVFLHEVDKQKPDFWNSSLSFIFMHMLKTYKACLDDYTIKYYWNERNNLLKDIDKIVIDNFRNFLSRVIDSVDKKMDGNPLIIADFLSTPDEQAELKKINFNVSTKKSKVQSVNLPVNVAETSDLISLFDTVSLKNIPENFNLNLLTENIVENKIEIVDEKIPQNNDKILLLLQGIQSSINILQSDFKFAMKKISDLEYSIQELKNDNVEFKTILQNSCISESGDRNSIDINKQIENQTYSIETLSGKLENLNKNVEILQNSNDALKSGLKSFVFQT